MNQPVDRTPRRPLASISVRARVWIAWLRQSAKVTKTVTLSPEGAKDLAQLLDVLARNP